MRHWSEFRPIPRNASSAVPALHCVVDTETRTVHGRGNLAVHRLRLGVARIWRYDDGRVTREAYYAFDRPDQFWNWLSEHCGKSRPVVIWSHNAGFDMRVLGIRKILRDGRLKLHHTYERKGKQCVSRGMYVDTDPPTIVSGWLDGIGRITWICGLNWWRCSLADLGDAIGHPKMPYPGDDASDREMIDYCQGDVDTLTAAVRGLVDWLRENDLGMMRWTAPAQSMAAWRHRFWRPIHPHDRADVRGLERAAYYSGRLQCLSMGNVTGPVHELDAVMAYTAILSHAALPIDLIDYSLDPNRTDSPVWHAPHQCIANVELDEFSELYPRRDEKGRILWRAGGETTLAGPELARAVTRGDVRRVGCWARYKLDQCAADYACWLWEERVRQEKAGNKAYSSLCKLMGNSWYGKFGQLTPMWVEDKGSPRLSIDVFDRHASVGPDGTVVTRRRIGDIIQKQVPRTDHRHAFPAICAYVTAHLRERMREWMEIAGKGNVHYVSTDCLHVNAYGLRKLWASNQIRMRELGELEHRGTYSKVEYCGPHYYCLDDEWRIAGVKRGAVVGPDGTVLEERFTGLGAGAGMTRDDGVVMQRRTMKLPKRVQDA